MSLITGSSMYPFVSVDPGKNTAVILWTMEGLVPSEFKYKLTIDDTAEYLLMMSGFLHKWIMEKGVFKPRVMVIEGTGLWDSLESQTSAKRGDTFGLSMLVGAYTAIAQSCGLRVFIIPPQEWKGQLSKHATAERVGMILDRRFPTEHLTDAAGLGLWAQGKFTVKGVIHAR